MNMVISIDQSKELWGINDLICNKLKDDGIEYYFNVQKSVIPLLLRFNSQNSVQPRDMCVSAPTGSGKTLAYAIPIVNLLIEKFISCLRALIILPGRELAIQVYNVFKKLTQDTNIKVLLAVGQNNFKDEQNILMGNPILNNQNNLFTNNHLYTKNDNSLECQIDILICTPGRLFEHINNTKGFSLNHLRFLVLDEADRLLGNAYSFWVKSLVESTYSSIINSSTSHNIDTLIPTQLPLQRLLFSATLSDNPRKLSLLGIKNPIIIRVGSSESTDFNNSEDIISANPRKSYTYILPSTLSESIRICTTEDRPKQLIALLVEEFGIYDVNGDDSDKLCIIFSSSVETTHRLCILLKIFNGQSPNIDSSNDDHSKFLFKGRIEEISRLMKAPVKEQTLLDALNGKVKILVASDQISRGIDLPNVKLVINYDPPKYAKTYIHRVGRTARANKIGHCITLLRNRQYEAFKTIRETIGHESNKMDDIIRRKIPKSLTDKITPQYINSLSILSNYIVNS